MFDTTIRDSPFCGDFTSQLSRVKRVVNTLDLPSSRFETVSFVGISLPSCRESNA